MDPIPVFPPDEAVPRMLKARRPFHAGCHAMYSSLLDGIVTTPALMVVPIDDHMVHRGDAVFETLMSENQAVYLLEPHLRRLLSSASKISLASPWTLGDLRHIVLATLRAAGQKDALVRILLSRGPGSMGVNPYDCPAPALYVLVHAFIPPFMSTHPRGARVVTSSVPVKSGFFPTVKSCNYLPNALMKMEALDAGADFALGLDEKGCLAEGPTENVAVVDAEGALLVPRRGRILSGTTLTRVLELALDHAGKGPLAAIEIGDIPAARLGKARELLILGTTARVTAVVELDGKPVGTGRPGPVCALLNRLLEADIRDNSQAW
jgi:branched-chain amino acid aminotransferase